MRSYLFESGDMIHVTEQRQTTTTEHFTLHLLSVCYRDSWHVELHDTIHSYRYVIRPFEVD